MAEVVMTIARAANINVNICKRFIFLFSDEEMCVCKNSLAQVVFRVPNNLTQKWAVWFRVK